MYIINHMFKNRHLVRLSLEKEWYDEDGKSICNYSIKFKNFKCPKGIILFIAVDKNIWWFPKIQKIKNDISKGYNIGWLFGQFGFVKFYDKEIV